MASKALAIAFLVILLFFLQLHEATESSSLSTTGHVSSEGKESMPTDYRVKKRIDCKSACKRRCKATSYKDRCKRACGVCCQRCNCVPPGTYGNREACPCYGRMRTHGNRLKCP